MVQADLLAVPDRVAGDRGGGAVADAEPREAAALDRVALEGAGRAVVQPHAVALVEADGVAVEERAARAVPQRDPRAPVARDGVALEHPAGPAQQLHPAALAVLDGVFDHGRGRVVAHADAGEAGALDLVAGEESAGAVVDEDAAALRADDAVGRDEGVAVVAGPNPVDMAAEDFVGFDPRPRPVGQEEAARSGVAQFLRSARSAGCMIELHAQHRILTLFLKEISDWPDATAPDTRQLNMLLLSQVPCDVPPAHKPTVWQS